MRGMVYTMRGCSWTRHRQGHRQLIISVWYRWILICLSWSASSSPILRQEGFSDCDLSMVVTGVLLWRKKRKRTAKHSSQLQLPKPICRHGTHERLSGQCTVDFSSLRMPWNFAWRRVMCSANHGNQSSWLDCRGCPCSFTNQSTLSHKTSQRSKWAEINSKCSSYVVVELTS